MSLSKGIHVKATETQCIMPDLPEQKKLHIPKPKSGETVRHTRVTLEGKKYIIKQSQK